MQDLPPEIRGRRQEIYDTVTRTGRARRRRRAALRAGIAAVVVAVPLTVVALHASHDGRRVQIAQTASTDTSTTTSPDETTATVPAATTAPSGTTAPAPTTAPTVTSPATDTTSPTATTVPIISPVCHNSLDPACGPLYYDPPLTNAPAHLVIVSISPAVPKVGEQVTITLRATDPDSTFNQYTLWCNDGHYSLGVPNDGESCIADCAAVPGYGPWDPPPPHPSDLIVRIEHTYTQAGAYVLKLTAEADVCGSRPSTASAGTALNVDPA